MKAMLGTRPAWLVRISHSLYHRTKPDAEIVHTCGAPVGFDAAIEKAWKSAYCASFPGRARAAV